MMSFEDNRRWFTFSLDLITKRGNGTHSFQFIIVIKDTHQKKPKPKNQQESSEGVQSDVPLDL